MTTLSSTEINSTPVPGNQPGVWRRSACLAYGIIAYTVGVTGLGAIILAMAGVISLGSLVPFIKNPIIAVMFNIALTLSFGLQHSVMARSNFKQRFNKLFGAASERSTFVAASGIVSLWVVGLWQPVGGVIWQANTTLVSIFLWAGFAFGWGYLLAASFAINHWDLFGLRQTWLYATNQPYKAPEFKLNWMYRFSRHPIMLGALIGMWCLPAMTWTQMFFSLTFTMYIFIGVAFEEKDLIKNFGQRYIDYKKSVGMFFTFSK
ncbi:MAG: hypothetical protein MI976_04430 [Pseudomonadales bacterium]|nr:hypothetical protein [Pseudomonadales bacterium]